MKFYITASIDTHLFFARIMREHALFLEAGFPCKNSEWIQKADSFRKEFEDILRQAAELGNGIVSHSVLKSQELTTRYTISAEEKTHCLTGIPIDTKISAMEQKLHPARNADTNTYNRMLRTVHQLNEKALFQLNGLIEFKESILREVKKGQLFTSNYPLLIQHILREAKLYRSTLTELIQRKRISAHTLKSKEQFWNQIMMEHALFIRGLLDPCEVQLIETADNFARTYEEFLGSEKTQDCRATMNDLTKKILQETLDYRDFKATGTAGILDNKIASIILCW